MSSRTPGGLVLLDSPGNGHPSASQRREQILQLQLAQALSAAQHYLTIVAALVFQQGGKATIPFAAIEKNYDLGFGKVAETGDLIYTSKVNEPKSFIVAPSEPPPS